MIRPFDIAIFLAGALTIVALGTNVYSGEAETLRVIQGHQQGEQFPLDQSREVRVAGPLGTTVIEIDHGRARVVSSPCRQKICIRSGWLKSAGDTTACVPNRVSATLLGRDARFDAVSF